MTFFLVGTVGQFEIRILVECHMENNTSSSPPHASASKLFGAVSQPSPRSDSVDKALRRHRKALEEIRAANSNLEDTVPTLNLNSKLDRVVFHSSEKMATDQAVAEPKQAARDGPWTTANVGRLCTWENPAASALAIIAGSFVYALLRSGSTTTLLCYVILSRIGWHVLGAMFSSGGSRHAQLVGSDVVRKWTDTMAKLMGLIARLHDEFIVTADTRRSVAVCAVLWALSAVGAYADMLQLCYVSFLSAFVVPNLGSGHISATCKQLALHLRQLTPSAILQSSTKQRRLSIAVVGASLWLAADWPNRLIGLLMALLCVRTTMSQAEVKKLRDQTAPMTMSVRKKAARMSRRVSLVRDVSMPFRCCTRRHKMLNRSFALTGVHSLACSPVPRDCRRVTDANLCAQRCYRGLSDYLTVKYEHDTAHELVEIPRHELGMEVAPDRVVDKLLPPDGLARCLVPKHHVVIPPPFHPKIVLTARKLVLKQRIATGHGLSRLFLLEGGLLCLLCPCLLRPLRPYPLQLRQELRFIVIAVTPIFRTLIIARRIAVVLHVRIQGAGSLPSPPVQLSAPGAVPGAQQLQVPVPLGQKFLLGKLGKVLRLPLLELRPRVLAGQVQLARLPVLPILHLRETGNILDGPCLGRRVKAHTALLLASLRCVRESGSVRRRSLACESRDVSSCGTLPRDSPRGQRLHAEWSESSRYIPLRAPTWVCVRSSCLGKQNKEGNKAKERRVVQQPTIHHPPSTIHHPPSTIHHPSSITHHPSPIIQHSSATGPKSPAPADLSIMDASPGGT